MFLLVLMLCWSARLQVPLPLLCAGSKVGQGQHNTFHTQNWEKEHTSVPSICFSRWAWGGFHTICWAGRSPRGPSHSRGARGRCRPVHLRGQQSCWHGYWYSHSEGWRWVCTSACTRSWRYLLNVYRGRFSHPFTVGPLFSEAPVDLMANIGENVTLPCAARGSPQPTVTWHRQDGGRILTGGHSRMMQLENGHLLIQGEFSMKHYHSRALASAAVCYDSVLPPTRWYDWDFTVWQTLCLSFFSFGHQYAEFCRCFEAAPV